MQDVLELAFSIVYDMEEYCLNFVAPTRYEVSSMGPLQPVVPARGQQGRKGSARVWPWDGSHRRGEVAS